MKNFRRLSAALLILVIAVSAISANGAKEAPATAPAPAAKNAPSAGNFAFGGSTTVEPIITAAIEDWSDLYPQVHISYEGVGSSSGIKGVLSGIYSLGAASREPKDSEKESGIIAVPVALDAIALVVNKNTVSVSNLTLEQAAAIYAGTITNWKEVGGQDAPIVVFNRDEASGTYETFETKVMGKTPFLKSASVTTGNGDMASKIGATPNSIGYVGLGFIHEKGLTPISLNGVIPTIENVYNKTYPVQRFLNVVYTGTLSGTEKIFVEYLLGEDGQDIVADLDFIPLP